VEHALGLAGALIIRHVRQVPDAGCVPRLRLDPAGAAARHRTPRSPMSSSRGRPAKNADGPAIRSPCVPIGRHTPTTKSKRRLRVNPVRRPSLSSCRRCVARAVETRSRGGLGRSVQADKVDQSGGPMRAEARWWPRSVLEMGSPKARDFAAWLGLPPNRISTGDRTIPTKISRRGNRYLRVLFVKAAV
jgi:hypothetical protein